MKHFGLPIGLVCSENRQKQYQAIFIHVRGYKEADDEHWPVTHSIIQNPRNLVVLALHKHDDVNSEKLDELLLRYEHYTASDTLG